jgi:hypothetical protein
MLSVSRVDSFCLSPATVYPRDAKIAGAAKPKKQKATSPNTKPLPTLPPDGRMDFSGAYFSEHDET